MKNNNIQFWKQEKKNILKQTSEINKKATEYIQKRIEQLKHCLNDSKEVEEEIAYNNYILEVLKALQKKF